MWNCNVSIFGIFRVRFFPVRNRRLPKSKSRVWIVHKTRLMNINSSKICGIKYSVRWITPFWRFAFMSLVRVAWCAQNSWLVCQITATITRRVKQFLRIEAIETTHWIMSSPEEVNVRESLFSASVDQAWTAKQSDDGSSGGGLQPEEENLYYQQYRGRPSERNTTSLKRDLMLTAGWRGGRGSPWRSIFARKPRSTRRAVMRAPWISPVAAHHLAALEVRDAHNLRIQQKQMNWTRNWYLLIDTEAMKQGAGALYSKLWTTVLSKVL